jgi:TRAP-type C4-dicarboxylate transport system permease small subunit
LTVNPIIPVEGANMDKIFKILDPWIERICLGFVGLSGTMMLVMAFLSTYGAARRYAFRSPEPISYELSKAFLLLSFVLALAVVERQDRLLRCDILLVNFPQTLKNIVLNIIGPILGITFFGILSWISFGDAMRALHFGEVSLSAWPIPLFPVKIMIPVGYGFFCFILLLRLVRGVLHIKTPTPEPQNSTG